jgi:hypothetical protein
LRLHSYWCRASVFEATEKLVNEINAVVVDGLTPLNAKGSGVATSSAFAIDGFEWLRGQDLKLRPLGYESA